MCIRDSRYTITTVVFEESDNQMEDIDLWLWAIEKRIQYNFNRPLPARISQRILNFHSFIEKYKIAEYIVTENYIEKFSPRLRQELLTQVLWHHKHKFRKFLGHFSEKFSNVLITLMEPTQSPPNSILWEANEDAPGVFFILHGEVLEVHESTKTLVKKYSEGEVFGGYKLRNKVSAFKYIVGPSTAAKMYLVSNEVLLDLFGEFPEDREIMENLLLDIRDEALMTEFNANHQLTVNLAAFDEKEANDLLEDEELNEKPKVELMSRANTLRRVVTQEIELARIPTMQVVERIEEVDETEEDKLLSELNHLLEANQEAQDQKNDELNGSYEVDIESFVFTFPTFERTQEFFDAKFNRLKQRMINIRREIAYSQTLIRGCLNNLAEY
eukprot:TRINITY_DN9305_c0_g1_i1.p1 TRINITY_DN9305_c0_g1~~TRINITY_DN9305_c0_g1_i1.p1  ORF type:complete len:405 (+),score=76.50 TRINITY_DN9305_c0_g1_i1:61-1215(+)